MSDHPQQLDLFDHSALNQALRIFAMALSSAVDASQADAAMASLRAVPQVSGALLRDCGELLQATTDATVLLRDPQRGLDYLRGRLTPLAQRWLGGLASGYLRLLQTRLAEVMDVRGFVTGRDVVHPAELWLELEQPRRARSSVTADLFWRGCPVRLALYARIHERLHDMAAAIDAWARLCWTDPQRAESGLPHSVVLGDAWQDFCDLEPLLDTVWFPAWLELTGRITLPALVELPDDAAGAAQLLSVLQRTPRAMRAAPELRGRVRLACPALLAHWLAYTR